MDVYNTRIAFRLSFFSCSLSLSFAVHAKAASSCVVCSWMIRHTVYVGKVSEKAYV